MKGRKRHLAVDTLGLLWAVSVHAANISESRGARLVVLRLCRHTHRVQKIVVDGGYFPVFINWVLLLFRCPVEIIKRSQNGAFQVLPKRWIVERLAGSTGKDGFPRIMSIAPAPLRLASKYP